MSATKTSSFSLPRSQLGACKATPARLGRLLAGLKAKIGDVMLRRSLSRISTVLKAFSAFGILFSSRIASFQCSLSGTPGKRLHGRVCLVTGAARGIGKGIALGLGDEGATVYVTGRTEKDVVQTANEVTSRGGRGIPVVVDHSKVEEIKGLFDKIRNEGDELHLLVNNCYSAAGKLFDQVDKKFYEKVFVPRQK
jgi:3-oxoacyl-ACP reductase-like protein